MPYQEDDSCSHGRHCSGCCDYCQGYLSESDYDDNDDDYDNGDEYRRPVIYGHGDGPPLVFHGEGPAFLGMELEVNIPDDMDQRPYGRKIQDLLGDAFWLQEDGSISYGFEITTHPMSYDWIMENFPWDVLSVMKDDGCYVSRSVGIHVHVSRRAFRTECHMYRWMKFIYRNASQVQRLARRRDSEWASFDPQYRASVARYIKGDSNGDTRYQAINPTKSDTLEVRVFASSLDPNEVKAALAFVASTVDYTRDLDANKIIKAHGWAWSSYVDWLRDRPEYRPILAELEHLLCVS